MALIPFCHITAALSPPSIGLESVFMNQPFFSLSDPFSLQKETPFFLSFILGTMIYSTTIFLKWSLFWGDKRKFETKKRKTATLEIGFKTEISSLILRFSMSMIRRERSEKKWWKKNKEYIRKMPPFSCEVTKNLSAGKIRIRPQNDVLCIPYFLEYLMFYEAHFYLKWRDGRVISVLVGSIPSTARSTQL